MGLGGCFPMRLGRLGAPQGTLVSPPAQSPLPSTGSDTRLVQPLEKHSRDGGGAEQAQQRAGEGGLCQRCLGDGISWFWLVPRGHPLEPLGSACKGAGEVGVEGMDQKTGCKGDVMGTDMD